MINSDENLDSRHRIVVLASGEGTNLQAIIDACESDLINGRVVAVVSNQASSGAIRRAKQHDIAMRVVTKLAGESRQSFDARLAEAVVAYEPDWVVLAGFMRVLSDTFVARFASHNPQTPSRIINLHPAAPGELPGIHAIERAFAEAQTGSRVTSGVMVHFVDSEGVDCGPVIASVAVPILATDTLNDFTARIHQHEHELLVSALQKICNQPLPSKVSSSVKEPMS
ncbi:MAG: phosphoribosylglycinamide formyltransferase [Ilumatobacteraceae bacterium]